MEAEILLAFARRLNSGCTKITDDLLLRNSRGCVSVTEAKCFL